MLICRSELWETFSVYLDYQIRKIILKNKDCKFLSLSARISIEIHSSHLIYNGHWFIWHTYCTEHYSFLPHFKSTANQYLMLTTRISPTNIWWSNPSRSRLQYISTFTITVTAFPVSVHLMKKLQIHLRLSTRLGSMVETISHLSTVIEIGLSWMNPLTTKLPLFLWRIEIAWYL